MIYRKSPPGDERGSGGMAEPARCPQRLILALLLTSFLSLVPVKTPFAQTLPEFSADTAFAMNLWQALRDARLVGENVVQSHAYPGQHPHGAVLQNLYATLDVSGEATEVIVNRGYAGKGISVQAVHNSPARYLRNIAVMSRATGLDTASNDWFWASYLPDGSLLQSDDGLPLAGRGGTSDRVTRCVDCHRSAPGADSVFSR